MSDAAKVYSPFAEWTVNGGSICAGALLFFCPVISIRFAFSPSWEDIGMILIAPILPKQWCSISGKASARFTM